MRLLPIIAAVVACGSTTQDWQPYFAWRPVWVDAYDDSEIKNGKFSYRKFGWVERYWKCWIDEEGEQHSGWRYRLRRTTK